MRADAFDWDSGNREKCQRHGLTIREIESVFAAPIAVSPDPAHSHGEERFKAIGTTAAGRHVFVVFVLRDRDGARFIRPISARYMHRKEIETYEEAASRTQDR